MREDVTPPPCPRPELSSCLLFREAEAAPHQERLGEASLLPKAGSLKQTLGQRWVRRSFGDVDCKEEGRTWQREKVPCVPEPAPPGLRQPLRAQSWARYFPTAEGNSPATHEEGGWEPGQLGLVTVGGGQVSLMRESEGVHSIHYIPCSWPGTGLSPVAVD